MLCTPSLVGLIARLGRFLPLAPRIALRDAGRNRAAAAPAISAVMAAVAGSVALALYLGAADQRDRDAYTYELPVGSAAVLSNSPTGWPADVATARVTDVLRADLPVTATYPLRAAACLATSPDVQCQLSPQLPKDRRCPLDFVDGQPTKAQEKAGAHDPRCVSGNGAQLLGNVDDGTALAALTGADPADVAAASRVLQAGGVVVDATGTWWTGRSPSESSVSWPPTPTAPRSMACTPSPCRGTR